LSLHLNRTRHPTVSEANSLVSIPSREYRVYFLQTSTTLQ